MMKPCKDHLGNSYSSFSDMCRFYGKERSSVRSRMSRGATLEDALTNNIRTRTQRPNAHACVDHEGNTFDSEVQLCKYWKIDRSTYRRFMSAGYCSEEAVKLSITKQECLRKQFVEDHYGNKYTNKKTMCEHYGLSIQLYNARRKAGLSKKEALEKDVNIGTTNVSFIDSNGEKYNSIKEYCKVKNLSYSMVQKRLNHGWNMRDLCKSSRMSSVTDHIGNNYKGITEMCKYYNIPRSTYSERRSAGWDVGKSLTTPVKEKNRIPVDHNGIRYNTFKEMCASYNMPYSMFSTRYYNLGWSLEEALTIPRNMYIGEYRVSECLKRLNVKFYHDCSIKTIFDELNISVNWEEFLSELQVRLKKAGFNWSKQKVQKLRPDFVLYTDDDNRICGVIEFDGEQHQNFVEYFFKTIEEFLKRSDSDFIKDSLWEYLNIPMLRIRYDQVDMIDDMVKDFLDNPKKYIENHNTYMTNQEYWEPLKEEKERIELAFAS